LHPETVLITGGAGFIGRALVAHSLGRGHRVVVIDNLCAGTREALSPFIDRIEFHQLDILDADGIDGVMADARPGIVFHLAAHHFVPFCEAHPRETLRVNVEGSQVVLGAAVRHRARRAIVASTGALYPSREDILGEEVEAAPADVYGLSKSMTEQVAALLATTGDTGFLVARLFNTYGPFETNPHLIPHIVECLRAGDVVVLGNTDTKRDYLYVDDAAEMLYRGALADIDGYAVVNLGTGIEHSAAEIVGAIESILGRPITIRVDPTRIRAVDKLHQKADTRRFHALTGMRARHTLADGLRLLLAHESMAGALTP
jgi:UDP-glucose 4-epimerase